MATVNWSPDAKKAFSLYAKLTVLFGMWPLHPVDLLWKIRWGIGVSQMIMLMGNTLSAIIENCGDATDSLDSLLLLTASVINFAKLIMYHVYREDLAINIISAIEDWSSNVAIDYRRVMIFYERIYKRTTYALITTTYWCTVLFILKAFVIDPDKFIKVNNNYEIDKNVTEFVLKRRYLYPSACFLNDVSDTLYPILVINQFIQFVGCCVVTGGSDSFFLALATHLCGQLEILRMKFSTLNVENTSSGITTSRETINDLFARHQHLLNLMKHLERAYNKIILTQIVMNIILISIAGFSMLINLKTGDFFGCAKNFGVVTFMLLQTFMYSCIGEALQNYGDDITQAVYNSSWYKFPTKVTKDLVFVMMRSNRSPGLTAGKFFQMTYVTFTKVVKTSSSVLSVLRIMINE